MVALGILKTTPQPENGPSNLGTSVDKRCTMIFGWGCNFKCFKSEPIPVNKEWRYCVALEVLKTMPQPQNGPSTLGTSVDK